MFSLQQILLKIFTLKEVISSTQIGLVNKVGIVTHLVLMSSSDYGFERSAPLKSQSSKCFADFWFNPEAPPEDCVLGQAYTSSSG